MYTKITHSICIKVEPLFLEAQSSPLHNHYVWAYQVWIENQGHETIQLLKRTWSIIDAHGITHEVKGEGVVGEQPSIYPGETFRYTSGTPLSTPSGIMKGQYHIKSESGESFDIEIPPFSLDSPYEISILH